MMICYELKNGSEAGGKSTEAVTLCHLSLESKRLLNPNASRAEPTDSHLENTLKSRKYTLYCRTSWPWP